MPKIANSYDDGDVRGMSVLDDGRVLLWSSEGVSDITVLTPDANGNLDNVQQISTDTPHQLNDLLQEAAEKGILGNAEEMSPMMVLLYDAVRESYGESEYDDDDDDN